MSIRRHNEALTVHLEEKFLGKTIKKIQVYSPCDIREQESISFDFTDGTAISIASGFDCGESTLDIVEWEVGEGPEDRD